MLSEDSTPLGCNMCPHWILDAHPPPFDFFPAGHLSGRMVIWKRTLEIHKGAVTAKGLCGGDSTPATWPTWGLDDPDPSISKAGLCSQDHISVTSLANDKVN